VRRGLRVLRLAYPDGLDGGARFATWMIRN